MTRWKTKRMGRILELRRWVVNSFVFWTMELDRWFIVNKDYWTGHLLAHVYLILQNFPENRRKLYKSSRNIFPGAQRYAR